MSNKNPYLDMALNLITNPWVLATAGGVAGYYLFGRQDGKSKKGKTPYIASAVGAGVGLATGKLIQHFRTQQTTAQTTASATAPAVDKSQQTAQGLNDYYAVGETVPDVDQAFNQAPPVEQEPIMEPVGTAPGVSYDEQGVPLQADIEEPMGMGSLDGTSLGSSGLGSFEREEGFDAFGSGVDEAHDEAKKFN